MRKVVYIQLIQVLSLLIGILITPRYLEYLPKEKYGFVILFAQAITYFSLFDFGIGGWLLQKVSVSLVTANGNIQKVVNTSFGAIALIILFSVPIIAILSINIDSFFALDFELSDQSKLLFSLSLLASVLSILVKPLISIQLAHEYLLFNSFSSFIAYFIYTVGSLLLLIFHQDIDSFFYAHIFSIVISVCINYFFVRSKRKFDFGIVFPSVSEFGGIIKGSAFIFLNAISAQLIYNGDRLVLAKFMTVSILTIFSLNIRIIEICQTFLIKITDLYIPKVIKAANSGSRKSLSYYKQLTKFAVIVSLALISNVLIFNSSFIGLWVGEKWILKDSSILYLYCTVMFSHTIFRIPSIFLYSIGENKGYTMTSFADAILNLVLSIVLVYFFEIKGVVVATLISTLLTSVPSNIYLLKKKMGIRYSDVVSPILNTLLLNLPVIMISALLSNWMQNQLTNWLNFATAVLIYNILLLLLMTIINFRSYQKLLTNLNRINYEFHR